MSRAPPLLHTFLAPGCVIRMKRACRGLPYFQDGGKDGLVAEVGSKFGVQAG